MNYEALLCEAEEIGLIVKEKPLKYNNGRLKRRHIAIRKDIETTVEKACVLAEELGHHHTTVGNILNQTDDWNRKQEQQARAWAYNKMIGLMGIVNAYKAGCRNAYEMSEYLGVTEEFLSNALKRYREKYGEYAVIDNYTVYFEPCLGVLEIQPEYYSCYR